MPGTRKVKLTPRIDADGNPIPRSKAPRKRATSRKKKIALPKPGPATRRKKPDTKVTERTLRRRRAAQREKEGFIVEAKKKVAKAAKQAPDAPPPPPPAAEMPLPEQIELVKILIGSGMTRREVAIVFGMTQTELGEKFPDALENARVHMKAKAVKLMWEMAENHSSPMVRKVIDITSVPQTREAFIGQVDEAATPDAKETAKPKLGKKEAQALAAQNPDPSDPMGALMAKRAARTRLN